MCSTPRPGLGTAVVMDDRSPSPRSARDQPQCHRSGGGSVSMSQGVYVSQRGSFRRRSTRTEHRPFSCESAWTGSAPNIALFRRGRPYRHRMNIAHFIGRRLVVPDAPRCMDSKGRCLFGRLVADGGRCRRGAASLARGTSGSTGSGTVDKAWATPRRARPVERPVTARVRVCGSTAGRGAARRRRRLTALLESTG